MLYLLVYYFIKYILLFSEVSRAEIVIRTWAWPSLQCHCVPRLSHRPLPGAENKDCAHAEEAEENKQAEESQEV